MKSMVDVNKHGAQHERLGNQRVADRLAGFVDLFAGQAKIGGGSRKKVAENGQCFSVFLCPLVVGSGLAGYPTFDAQRRLSGGVRT